MDERLCCNDEPTFADRHHVEWTAHGHSGYGSGVIDFLDHPGTEGALEQLTF